MGVDIPSSKLEIGDKLKHAVPSNQGWICRNRPKLLVRDQMLHFPLIPTIPGVRNPAEGAAAESAASPHFERWDMSVGEEDGYDHCPQAYGRK